MTKDRKTSKEIEVDFPEEENMSSQELKDDETITSEDSVTDSDNRRQKSQKKMPEKEDYQHKYEALNEQFLRVRAEFANYKKRMEREQLDLTQYIKSEVVRKFLPILDDFDQMIQKSDDETSKQSVLEGAKIIFEKFREILADLGIERIEALDADFDPQFHEAVMMQEVDDAQKSGKVINVFQEGYVLNNRLIRPSKVVVGKHNDN